MCSEPFFKFVLGTPHGLTQFVSPWMVINHNTNDETNEFVIAFLFLNDLWFAISEIENASNICKSELYHSHNGSFDYLL